MVCLYLPSIDALVTLRATAFVHLPCSYIDARPIREQFSDANCPSRSEGSARFLYLIDSIEYDSGD